MLFWFAAALVALTALALAAGLYQRNVHLWIAGHTRRALALAWAGTRRHPGPTHLMFLFVDHYEPLAAGADDALGRRRVQRWLDEYPRLAGKFTDADGCHPKHSFFYPEEEYRAEYLDMLGRLCSDGFGEVEVHLHHDNDTAAGLTQKLQGFVATLHQRHGMLPLHEGRPRFGFIHGNWALDNSRCDGRWCGVNNELKVLADNGCYADFTLPSAPNDTQTSTVNSIYYAVDDIARPKSHDKGAALVAGQPGGGDLLIFQGPLALNWKRRRVGLWPKTENADIEPHEVPVAERLRLWVRQWVHVQGRPEWVFVKVHTHGAIERNADWIFGGECERLFETLRTDYNDGKRFVLHYVSAREAYNIVKAAEAGKTGDPGDYRDFVLPAPPHLLPQPSASQAAHCAG
jgi:hypothetical protein